jgi:hypothetical protein
MLSVVLSVITLNVRMLSIVLPNAINVNVVMLKVAASIAKTRQGPLTEREKFSTVDHLIFLAKDGKEYLTKKEQI